jgi:hypothetical protein
MDLAILFNQEVATGNRETKGVKMPCYHTAIHAALPLLGADSTRAEYWLPVCFIVSAIRCAREQHLCLLPQLPMEL